MTSRENFARMIRQELGAHDDPDEAVLVIVNNVVTDLDRLREGVRELAEQEMGEARWRKRADRKRAYWHRCRARALRALLGEE